MEGFLLKERLKNLIYSVDKNQPNIFFMHIPKTGGTSVDIAISKFYKVNLYKIDPISSKIAAKILAGSGTSSPHPYNMFVFRQYLASCEMAEGTKYITGHVRFNLDLWNAYNSQYAYVTVLREPVKRYISEYYFNLARRAKESPNNLDLSDFIDSRKGKDAGQTYINYFANNYCGECLSVEEKLEAAKKNLYKFKIVGFLENLELFKTQFQEAFQLNLKIPYTNKNPVSKPQIEDSVIKKIAQICQPDIELYNYAKDNFLEA